MTSHTLTNTFRVHGIGIIDAIISTTILIVSAQYKAPQFVYDIMTTYNSTLIALIWFAFYRLLTIAIFNKTIGMKLLNVEFLTQDMHKPSFLQKVFASFFILVDGIRYYNVR